MSGESSSLINSIDLREREAISPPALFLPYGLLTSDF